MDASVIGVVLLLVSSCGYLVSCAALRPKKSERPPWCPYCYDLTCAGQCGGHRR